MKSETSWRRGRFATSIPLFMAALLAACGDSGGPTPPEGTPAFTLSLSASTATVTAGASASVTVNVVRSGGFEGAVAVAVEGLPQGVTTPALTIAAGATSGMLQLNAAAGAATGTSSLTVRATGTGVDARTATLSLTINSADTPDFAISLDASNKSVQAGSSTQLQVSLSRTGGFNGPVELTTAGVPAGVTATFNPATIPTGSATSTLTLTASAGAAVATSTVTVRGTAAGVTGERTAVLALQVTGGSPSGGDIVWSFCGITGLPVWLAVQDGNGAWSRVTGSNGRFEFDLNASRGGVAHVIEQNGGLIDLDVFYGTKAEISAYGESLCEDVEGPGRTVNGTVTGFTGPTDAVVVALGGVMSSQAPTMGNRAVTFDGVPDGPADLLGSISTFDLGTFEMAPTRIFAQRGLNPAAGSTLPIDFAGANSFAPARHSLTLNGAGGEEVFVATMLRTEHGILPTLGLSTSATSWYSLPANRIETGDLHIMTATAAGLQELSPSRTTVRMIAQPGNLTINLGPALTAPTVTASAGAGQRLAKMVYPIQPQYERYWVATFNQGATNGNRSTTVQVSRGYHGSGSGSVTLEIPELDGVAGWSSTWGLRPSELITWSLSAVGWDTPGGIDHPPFTDGSEYRSASRLGQIP